jgi:cyanate permease
MALVGAVHVSLALLVVGLVVLDAGIQGSQITNQAVIYALDGSARSRLTTAYMTSVFVAAALGSLAASIGWSAGGWAAITGIGIALPVLALLLWTWERVRGR